MDVIPLRLADCYQGRTVLVTGHMGFKGAWLTLWLRLLEARVVGYSLEVPSQPNLFDLLGLAGDIDHHKGDIRNSAALRDVVSAAKPDYVFHLAAQPLVRLSYQQPLETLQTNALGTANVLEAVRVAGRPCAVVVVTTDKCYENREWVHGYRESDPMGGYDPYSMSKGCAELVVAAWRRSFFAGNHAIRVATARSGNVLGGGDWGADRVMPDCISALCRGATVPIRNPGAVRPWQHVLDPLHGYLKLGARLASPQGSAFAEAWNFGPPSHVAQTVRQLVGETIARWGSGSWEDVSDPRAPHEAGLLALSIDKATFRLGWRPAWPFARAIAETVAWYKAWHGGQTDMRALSVSQVRQYEASVDSTGEVEQGMSR